jgi:hypothetical protein
MAAAVPEAGESAKNDAVRAHNDRVNMEEVVKAKPEESSVRREKDIKFLNEIESIARENPAKCHALNNAQL